MPARLSAQSSERLLSQAEGPSGTEGLGLTGPPESAGPTGPGTPSDDQYKDSLSKLASRLE